MHMLHGSMGNLSGPDQATASNRGPCLRIPLPSDGSINPRLTSHPILSPQPAPEAGWWPCTIAGRGRCARRPVYHHPVHHHDRRPSHDDGRVRGHSGAARGAGGWKLGEPHSRWIMQTCNRISIALNTRRTACARRRAPGHHSAHALERRENASVTDGGASRAVAMS